MPKMTTQLLINRPKPLADRAISDMYEHVPLLNEEAVASNTRHATGPRSVCVRVGSPNSDETLETALSYDDVVTWKVLATCWA